MRILVCHNRYGSGAPSGENAVADRETALLEAIPGWEVARWELRSDDLIRAGLLRKAKTAWDLPGSAARRAAFVDALAARAPQLLHAHNLWPLFTYDLPRAAHALGIPTIQTLHNFRMIATNTAWIESGALRAAQSAADHAELRRMGSDHHGRLVNAAYGRALARLWQEHPPPRAVDAFICLTRFQQERMVAAGIPRSQTVVKPNFLDYQGPTGTSPGDYALFVGRLDATKGIEPLLCAWPATGLPLRIIGDGPLAGRLPGGERISFLGSLPKEDVLACMANARFLVMNSAVYEGFPLVLVEALAVGTPCLVPDLGALPGIIRDGELGSVFRHDEPDHLAHQAAWLWDDAPRLRTACRAAFEADYTAARNRARLEAIYANVLARRPPAEGLAEL